jgi:predicted amidohydrolase
MARPGFRGVPFGRAIFTTVTKAWQTELRTKALRGAVAVGGACYVSSMPPRMPFRIAAVQMCSTEDIPANLARAAELVTSAAAAGANLIGLPENFAYLGSGQDHKLGIAETLTDPASPPIASPTAATDGPVLTAMRRLARDTGAWLLLGGFPEKVRENPGKLANTSVLLDPEGTIKARYRKLHLFDVEIPGGHRFCESDAVVPGDRPVVAETPWGGLGLTICYDLRFPELYRDLVQKGARILSVPAAFTRETGKDHWHVLLRARAIENLSHVFAPAQWGFHGGKRASYGHAMVVDPWGVILAECGERDGYALAEVDLSYQDAVRTTLPCLSHRRL